MNENKTYLTRDTTAAPFRSPKNVFTIWLTPKRSTESGFTVGRQGQETVQAEAVTEFSSRNGAEGERRSEIYMKWVWKCGGGVTTWAHDCCISVTLVLSAHKKPLCSALHQCQGQRHGLCNTAAMKTHNFFYCFNDKRQERVLKNKDGAAAHARIHTLSRVNGHTHWTIYGVSTENTKNKCSGSGPHKYSWHENIRKVLMKSWLFLFSLYLGQKWAGGQGKRSF